MRPLVALCLVGALLASVPAAAGGGAALTAGDSAPSDVSVLDEIAVFGDEDGEADDDDEDSEEGDEEERDDESDDDVDEDDAEDDHDADEDDERDDERDDDESDDDEVREDEADDDDDDRGPPEHAGPPDDEDQERPENAGPPDDSDDRDTAEASGETESSETEIQRQRTTPTTTATQTTDTPTDTPTPTDTSTATDSQSDGDAPAPPDTPAASESASPTDTQTGTATATDVSTATDSQSDSDDPAPADTPAPTDTSTPPPTETDTGGPAQSTGGLFVQTPDGGISFEGDAAVEPTDLETGAATWNGQSGSDHRLATDRRVGLDTSRVAIVGVEPPWDWVRRGLNATVRVTLRNPGPEPANRTLVVRVDEDQVASQRVQLAPGERAEVPVEFAAESGVVSVEGVTAGRIAVGKTPTRPSAATESASGAGAGGGGREALPLATLGGLIALASGVVLVAVSLAARRE